MRPLKYLIPSVLALSTLTACGTESVEHLKQAGSSLQQAGTEIVSAGKDAAKESIQKLEVIPYVSETLAYMKSLNLTVQIQDNAITFTDNKNLNGSINLDLLNVVLTLEVKSGKAEQIQTVVRIMQLFSGDLTLADQLQQALEGGSAETIQTETTTVTFTEDGFVIESIRPIL